MLHLLIQGEHFAGYTTSKLVRCLVSIDLLALLFCSSRYCEELISSILLSVQGVEPCNLTINPGLIVNSSMLRRVAELADTCQVVRRLFISFRAATPLHSLAYTFVEQ